MAAPDGKPDLPALTVQIAGAGRVLCCHRATLSGRFPANSLPGVAECVAAGVPRLEIDVRYLADDTMLVLHDAGLDRETTGRGPAGVLTRESAASLRLRGSEAFGIPVLEEVVDALRGSSTVLQVDLKLMRPITGGRAGALASALAPLGERALVGSTAHWNIRALAALGLRVGFDPTLHWHYAPDRDGAGLSPSAPGRHGLWDDAPLAHLPGVAPVDYVLSRIEDLAGLAPAACEWMVDVRTLRHVAALGVPLGEVLRARGVELAAWTVRDEGERPTTGLLRELFALGATTIITDHPLALAAYLARTE